MKFYLNDGVEIQISADVVGNVVVVNDLKFWHNNTEYIIKPIEFKIDDIYFMIHQMTVENPGKKIFIHHFEPLANDFYAMFYAIEH